METSGENLANSAAEAALSLDDALPVISQAMSDNTILVGGQAINLWATLLLVDVTSPYLTRDIDFVGNRQDAINADQRISLPHQLFLASQDDASINAAVISVEFPGDEQARPIDYLMTIYGLDRTDINKTAIEIEIDNVIIKVIHPILLLQSKICNLNLAAKQTAEGIAQARASISIVKAFIESTINNIEVSPRQNLKLIRKVIHFSKSDFSVRAFHKFGIDTLEAIPLEALRKSSEPMLNRFADKGMAIDVRQVARARKTNNLSQN